jgi:hypothetical protein
LKISDKIFSSANPDSSGYSDISTVSDDWIGWAALTQSKIAANKYIIRMMLHIL